MSEVRTVIFTGEKSRDLKGEKEPRPECDNSDCKVRRSCWQVSTQGGASRVAIPDLSRAFLARFYFSPPPTMTVSIS